MAILIAQVWKEIIIYLMSTSKAQNGPQKIPFSFNNIYVWRVCIMLSVSNTPLVANICKLLFHMQEKGRLFHVSLVAFLNSKRQEHDIIKLIWDKVKRIMTSTREEFCPLHIISSVHLFFFS